MQFCPLANQVCNWLAKYLYINNEQIFHWQAFWFPAAYTQQVNEVSETYEAMLF